jgi:argininosuccinate lyase
VTGRVVALADSKKLKLNELSLADLQSIEPKITKDIFKVLTVENSVALRRSLGGTSPANVKREATRWLKQLKGKQK